LEEILERSGEPLAAQETRHVVVEQRGTRTLLVLEGDIGLDAAADLRTEAERLLAGSGGLAIDWHAAAHVGAGAIQVLLALNAALSARGGSLQVARDNPGVRRFLELAGLSDRFPVLEESA
jgi:anti-anti-sigma factor